MNIKTPAPKRLSVLLTLAAVAGLVIFLATLLFVAARLATEFDTRARDDARQRVEGGLAALVSDLEAVSNDYSAWTAHYQALRRQDIAWLEENVGSGAYAGDLMQLVILGGGPLEGVQTWSADALSQLAQTSSEALIALTEAEIARRALQPDDLPMSVIRWVEGELWLLTANLVVPHTGDVTLVLPTAILLLGVPLERVLPARLGDTLLLSDVRIDTEPGTPGASHALAVSDGPPAWVSWTLPQPGTDAILAVALPTGIALCVIVLLLGVGTCAVRRLALQLETALAVAEAASKAKSDFLATMSHELRTPLNAVLGMADLLGDTSPTKAQRQMIQAIQEAGRSLLFLVNDILDLARVESGKLALETRPFALSSLMAKIESIHGATARGKGIALQIRHPAGGGRRRLGDEMRVSQILHNIIGNAVKFTESGRVTVEVCADDPALLTFRVTDTGIGMTPDQIARVFEPFEQADAGTTRRFGGSGLGMSIARSLLEMMGGRISVNSTAGQGTEVVLTLPLPETEQAPDPRPEPALPEDDAPSAERLRNCRLLVAEDNATNRKIIALMLDRLGVTTVFAPNGAEACARWREQPFDLVLMDISMPEVDGFEALEIMTRDSTALRRQPPRVIAATANVMQTQLDDYKAKGFVDILAKPYRRSELQKILVRQLEQAEAG